MEEDDIHGDTKIECNNCNNKVCYNKDKIFTVRIIYSIFIVLWILIIYLSSIYMLQYSWLLIIPIIMFLIAIINAPNLSEAVETEMSKIIYFPMLIIVCINALIWIGKDYTGDVKLISKCIFLAIIFLLLSSVDLWVNTKWIYAYRHIQSAFETLSVGLIIFTVIIYGMSFTS